MPGVKPLYHSPGERKREREREKTIKGALVAGQQSLMPWRRRDRERERERGREGGREGERGHSARRSASAQGWGVLPPPQMPCKQASKQEREREREHIGEQGNANRASKGCHADNPAYTTTSLPTASAEHREMMVE